MRQGLGIKRTPDRHYSQPTLSDFSTLSSSGAGHSLLFAMHSFLLLLAPFVLATLSLAAPSQSAALRRVSKRDDVTMVSSSDLDALSPFTHFAGATYCGVASIQNWTCGTHCDALTGFKPTVVGGDGNSVQFCMSRCYT
jgi:hypothetical protein